MKILLLSILMPLLVLSCSTTHRMTKSEDPGKAVKSMEMTDKLSVYSAGMSKEQLPQRLGSIKTIHHFQVVNVGSVYLSVGFISAKWLPDSKSDLIVQLMLDGEKFEISSQSDHRFYIPENLWVPIVNCRKIEYLLLRGMEGFALRPNQAQTKELICFFERAIRYRDSNLPPTPEGLKKW